MKYLFTTLVVLFAGTSAFGQFVDDGAGPGQNAGRPGFRSPGILVQNGIVSFNQGPEITQPDENDPDLRLEVINEFFRNIFAQLNVLINLLPTLLNPGTGIPGGGGGGGQVDQIVMTEIAHNGNVVFVELLNLSGIQTRLNGFRFSDGDTVSPPLPQIELDRDDSIVVQLGGETQNSLADFIIGFRVQSLSTGELALYNFDGLDGDAFPIEDSSFITDYIQWNNDPTDDRDPTLEAVATQANLWNSVDTIPSSLSSNTFRLAADAERRDGTRSADITVLPFSDNTLGTPESQFTPMP